MKTAVLLAAVMLVGLAPRASLAQLRSVSNEERTRADAPVPAASAIHQWEEAIATRVTDAEVWSTIGQRLYAAERYRECISALEQSLVLRARHAPVDDQLISDAYAKLGNMRQSLRWSNTARKASALVPPAPRGVAEHKSAL